MTGADVSDGPTNYELRKIETLEGGNAFAGIQPFFLSTPHANTEMFQLEHPPQSREKIIFPFV